MILFVCILPFLLAAQDTPGLLGANGISEREATTYSLDRNEATLVIESSLDDFTVEVNGRTLLISKEEENWKIFVLPPGTNAITIRADGYEPLLLDEYLFRKNKVYGLLITQERSPQNDESDPGKGSITIATIPDGALLTVDGEPGEWMSPITIPDLTPAIYTIRVHKENYDSAVVQVKVLPDSAVVIPSVSLHPRFGYLIVDYDPEEKLFLNGVVLNNESNMVFRLRCGFFNLEITKEGHKTYLQTITITPGDTLTIIPQLLQDIAFFDFSNLPEGSDIFLDNNESARMVVETVPAEHSVRITTSEYGVLTKRFLLNPEETKVIDEKDFLDPGSITVTSDVQAKLFINDVQDTLSAGKSNLPPGTYSIRLEHPDFGTEDRNIRLLPREKKAVFIPMRPSRSTAMMLAIIPGASQIYNGMTLKGLTYFTGFALSMAGSYYFKTEYDRRYRSYTNYINEYRQTNDPLRAIELNSIINSIYPKVTTDQDRQYLAYGITGTVFLWNLIDLFLFEPASGYRQKDEMTTTMSVSADDRNLALHFNVTF